MTASFWRGLAIGLCISVTLYSCVAVVLSFTL